MTHRGREIEGGDSSITIDDSTGGGDGIEDTSSPSVASCSGTGGKGGEGGSGEDPGHSNVSEGLSIEAGATTDGVGGVGAGEGRRERFEGEGEGELGGWQLRRLARAPAGPWTRCKRASALVGPPMHALCAPRSTG